jgi:glycosyltransferase involved in cell wall biosynthesis
LTAGAMAGEARRPRVLFVGPTTYDLPLPSYLAKKWDALAERMELRVIGRASALRAQDPRFRLVNVPRRAPAGAFHLALVPIVTAEARHFKPDVIITQSPFEALPTLAARLVLRPRPRLVVEVHGEWRMAARVYGSRARRLYAGLADRAAVFALRRADGVRALAPFTEALVRHATGREPICSFPAYTDLDGFLEDPVRQLPDRPTVAWVGVLDRAKNPHAFARAWRIVAERLPEARAVIRGTGPLRPVMDELVRDFPGRVEVVPWLPATRDVARLVDGSTLLALPSWSEGLPRAAVEAFTRGRPVVGSAAGGIPDIVKPERNGLLVPPGDAERLADALVRVLSDRELAERLGRGALEDAGRFHWSPERYADAVRDMVDRAMALR